MNDQKNLILAIALSVVIMVTFQYFFEPPPPPPQETQQTQGEQAAPGQQAPTDQQQQTPSASATPSPSTGAAPAMPPGGAPATAVAPAGGARTVIEGPRITIDTPRLEGSIALRGAAIDDVTLRDYHVTTDPSSDRIRIFAPQGNVRAYYATEGWIPADPNVPVPGQDTVWSTSEKVLTHEKPVTLTWENGAGLIFERTIAVDENYMFTITQNVRNTGEQAVTLTPYSLINRTGTPETTGFYILHEGPLGVFDGTLVEEDYDDVAEEKTITRTSTGGWIGITDKYWLAALVPESNARVNARFLHWRTGNQDKYQADFAGEAQTLSPGGSVQNKTYLFSGAKQVRLLDGYADKLGIANFDLAIDFGWFYFLTKPFFYLLD
ncbi:MAG: membrane protein insertase YidC, partial [Acetobacterales bacterium]